MRFEPKWLPGRIWHPAHVRFTLYHPRSARRKISSGTTIGIVHAHFVGRSKIDLTFISDTKMFGMCRIQYGKEISHLYPTKKYVVSVGYNPNRTTRKYCIYIYIYIYREPLNLSKTYFRQKSKSILNLFHIKF